MKMANFSLEQLKALPLRAIVAFAARCARRVEPLAQLPVGDPRGAGRREAIAAALRMTESFARGEDAVPDESVIAAIDAIKDAGVGLAADAAAGAIAQAVHAAASAWHAGPGAGQDRPPGRRTAESARSAGVLSHVTADLAAMNAFTAAADAFVSIGYNNEGFVDAGLGDYGALVRLKLGRYPELGPPIDPSPEGPLGPL